MATLTAAPDDSAAYVDHERPVLAMLSTRYRDLDPDGRRELYHEAWASVFIALGGTSYAVTINSIGTREVKNNSLRSGDVRNGTLSGKDVKRGSLGGTAIKESALRKVPRATTADIVGHKSSSQLTVRCPTGTRSNMGACIELAARPEQAYGTAKVACETINRRLPMHQELEAYGDDSPTALTPGGELTANVYPGDPVSKPLKVLIITSQGGAVDVVEDTFAGSRPFRCVATPSN